MKTRRSLRTVEALEPRIALSAAGHAIHAAVHQPALHLATAHHAPENAPAIPNPVLVNLTPNVQAITISDVSYDSRVNLITVKGTVDVSVITPPQEPYDYPPEYPSTVYLGVNVNQAVNRFQSVSGSQFSDLTINDASVTKLPFVEKIVAYSGKFGPGQATIAVSLSEFYTDTSETVIVHLRPAKAY